MPRYIDADALMKEFRDFVRASNNSDFAPVPNWNDAVSLVGSAPTADVVERKKGKWIIIDSDEEKYEDIKCPNCKMNFTVDACRWCDIGFTVDDLKFCPNCGAEMQMESQEEVK